MKKNFVLIAVAVAISLCIAEILLRITGTGTTFTEKREGVFINPAARLQTTWYAVWPPHFHLQFNTSEFNYSRVTNAEGLSDTEWSIQKAPNEIRIMTLGDSYTEGEGCSYDSTYPKLLEGLLQKEFSGATIHVMNAGHCGSDPWFEYKKFTDRLLKYKPDIVLYTNGSNDLAFDHLYLGGMERFMPDSTIKNQLPNPSWLRCYQWSYVCRAVATAAGFDETLLSSKHRQNDLPKAVQDSRLVSRSFSSLAVKNNFSCLQIIRVDRGDIYDGYPFAIAQLTAGNDRLPNYNDVNLLPYYIDSIHISPKNMQQYYWPVNGHHTPKGYAIMAQAVLEAVKKEVAKKLVLLSSTEKQFK